MIADHSNGEQQVQLNNESHRERGELKLNLKFKLNLIYNLRK